MKQRKQEKESEDSAQSIGNMSKSTGEGIKKKCHYKAFKFHDSQYGLEDSVLLAPAKTNKKPYVAIIKDIYIQGKQKCLKLEVEWFYRPDDIAKKYVGNWESKDSRDLFYSFHRDEVFAESVMHKCLVYFVPENKKIPNRNEHPGFIIQKVYDNVKKKLVEFNYQGFDVQQKDEIDCLVAKTISRIGDLPDIEKVHMITKILRRKMSVPKRFILKAERRIPEISTKVNQSDDKSTWNKIEIGEASGMSSNGLDRDKILEELLEAVKLMCCTSNEKQAGDCDFFWPNDVAPVVRALEQALYGSLGEDIPKYNYMGKILVDKLKNSRVLTRRLLNGELKPEKAIEMVDNELMLFHFEELILEEDVASTSKSAGHKDSLGG